MLVKHIVPLQWASICGAVIFPHSGLELALRLLIRTIISSDIFLENILGNAILMFFLSLINFSTIVELRSCPFSILMTKSRFYNYGYLKVQ